MFNKHRLLQNIGYNLLLIVISLLLIYFNAINLYNPGLFISSTMLHIKTKTAKIKQNIIYSLDSIVKAPTYKANLIYTSSLLNNCQTELEKSKQDTQKSSDIQIIATNYPEYGYITISSKNKQVVKDSIVTTKNNILIGIVEQTYPHMATVLTPNAKDFHASVYIKQAKAPGVLQNTNNTLIIKDINIRYKLKKDYEVYLLDYRFPSNIFIGKIQTINKYPQSALQQAKIKYPYSMNDLTLINNIKIIPPHEQTTK